VTTAGPGGSGPADGRGGPLLRHSIGWRDQLRAALRPILAYHLTLTWALACFATVLLLSDGGNQENLVFLVVMGSTSVVGVLLGQATALTGIRTWLVALLSVACWIMAFAASMASRGSEVAPFLFMVLFMLPFAMIGGAWSLATNRALFSVWLPLIFATAAVIVWADFTDADDACSVATSGPSGMRPSCS
jgi:type IV secretory pathway TrbD component